MTTRTSSSTATPDKIRTDALRRLSRRAWSQRRLTEALIRRWRKADLVEQIIADLCRVGLIDDESLSRTAVEHELAKAPIGSRAMHAKLLHAGVDYDIAKQVVDEAFADRNAFEDAMTLGRKKLQSLPTSTPREKLIRRLADHLARKGFDGETVADVIYQLAPDR